MNCIGFDIPVRSDFAFRNSHDSKALRGWSQSGRVLVAGLQGGGSEVKPSVEVFVVEDCDGGGGCHSCGTTPGGLIACLEMPVHISIAS